MNADNKKEWPWYLWEVGIMSDGEYHFIAPPFKEKATQYIAQHGGGIYTHAGYLVFASDQQWWNWLTKGYDKKCQEAREKGAKWDPPHIDIWEIDCIFSDEALQWVKDNEEELKAKGENFYGNIPRVKGADDEGSCKKS